MDSMSGVVIGHLQFSMTSGKKVYMTDIDRQTMTDIGLVIQPTLDKLSDKSMMTTVGNDIYIADGGDYVLAYDCGQNRWFKPQSVAL